MSFIIVDVEADGPIPAEHSMVCFGAVLFDDALDKSFYGQTCPISDRFVPDALAVSGFSRDQHLKFDPFEEFLTGDFRVRPSLRPGQRILYRGWMLTPQQYSRLHAEIVATGAAMVTSPEQYERCHHLPKWYAQLREFTPETCFFQESDDVATRLGELSWKGCFLKDYVKSLSIEDGSMVRDLTRIPEVIAKMKTYRGEIEGGLCAREIEEFTPETEERYFVFKSRPFCRSGRVPDVVRAAAERIDSPFFTVDVVQRRDGAIRIIELGDGQVSDRKKWTVAQLLDVLRTEHPSIYPDI